MVRKYIEYQLKKMWVEWCDSCGHGFKVDAEAINMQATKTKVTRIGRLLGRKPKVITENIKPEPSACPVCGKPDNVTVIKLKDDKVEVIVGSD